jgi:hypothetical protein
VNPAPRLYPIPQDCIRGLIGSRVNFLRKENSRRNSSYKVDFFHPIKNQQKYLLGEQKNLTED